MEEVDFKMTCARARLCHLCCFLPSANNHVVVERRYGGRIQGTIGCVRLHTIEGARIKQFRRLIGRRRDEQRLIAGHRHRIDFGFVLDRTMDLLAFLYIPNANRAVVSAGENGLVQGAPEGGVNFGERQREHVVTSANAIFFQGGRRSNGRRHKRAAGLIALLIKLGREVVKKNGRCRARLLILHSKKRNDHLEKTPQIEQRTYTQS